MHQTYSCTIRTSLFWRKLKSNPRGDWNPLWRTFKSSFRAMMLNNTIKFELKLVIILTSKVSLPGKAWSDCIIAAIDRVVSLSRYRHFLKVKCYIFCVWIIFPPISTNGFVIRNSLILSLLNWLVVDIDNQYQNMT